MSSHEKGGRFLERWSERKQQASRPVGCDVHTDQTPLLSGGPMIDERAEHLMQGPAVATMDAEQNEQVAPEHLSPGKSEDGDSENAPPRLTDVDMPAVESLTAQSDLSIFFSEGVSAALRKAALRHVFQQPSYNLRDGLNDYDGDFTAFEPLGDTITADMKFHAARKEKAKQEAERLAGEQALAEQQGERGDRVAGLEDGQEESLSADIEPEVKHDITSESEDEEEAAVNDQVALQTVLVEPSQTLRDESTLMRAEEVGASLEGHLHRGISSIDSTGHSEVASRREKTLPLDHSQVRDGNE